MAKLTDLLHRKCFFGHGLANFEAGILLIFVNPHYAEEVKLVSKPFYEGARRKCNSMGAIYNPD